MPFTFIDIEERKTRIVWCVFLFLTFLYFVGLQLVWLCLKQALYLHYFYRSSKYEALYVFAAAFLIAIIHWIFSVRNLIPRVIQVLGAIEPDRNDSYHTMFRNIVEEVSIATGGRKIAAYVIPTAGLNACAISDTRGNSAIGVTEGLLARLNRSQLEGVIAHEAAHIVSNDSITTSVVTSLFGIFTSTLEKLGKVVRAFRGAGMVYIILIVMQFVNHLLYMFLSRTKEYRADAVAIRLSRNPIALAEALYIITHGWRGKGAIPDSLGPIFIISPEHNALDEKEGFVSNLFSTHPPAGKRIGTLLEMAHSNLEFTEDGLARPPAPQFSESSLSPSGVSLKQWFIFKEGDWLGPLDVAGLMAGGLDPNSWVSRTNEKRARLASEYGELTGAIRQAGSHGDCSVSCSKCRQPLSEVRYEGALAYKCRYCGGMLVDPNVGFRLLVRKGFSFPPEIERVAMVAARSYAEEGLKYKSVPKLECPKCRQSMRHNLFSYGYPIESDRCDICQYIWFDKNKFEALQCLYEKFGARG